MKTLTVMMGILLLFGCDRFAKPVPVTDADYVVLRPVSATPAPGMSSALAYGRPCYFRPDERIIDLRHLDLRTAHVEKRGDGDTADYYIPIRTNPEGARLLKAWTSTHVQQQLGVFVGGKLIATPVIKSPIEDGIVLEGELTKEQLEEIEARLSRGGAA